MAVNTKPNVNPIFIIILFFLCLLSFFANSAFGQIKNSRTRLHSPLSSEVFDTLSVVPGQFFVSDFNGQSISNFYYKIDYFKATIFYSDSIPDSCCILKYRVFDINFTETKRHKNSEIILENNSYRYNPQIENDNITELDFGNSELRKEGSITRGISFGNNRDVIVNSGLNLQLNGKISRDVSVIASVSDENIPIQPEGNSQQIQEFDKVFIKIFGEKTEFVVGDFEIISPTGYFLKTYKKVQGGIVKTSFGDSTKFRYKTHSGGAIAKGRYAHQTITVQEGNQGPYKLSGYNNELYIMVLAGTERVFFNGKLLTRGATNDYVIDYNATEIRFTANVPIAQSSRIIVEFEYSDKNYARFILYSANTFESEKNDFFVNVFSETDSKNQSNQQNLSTIQKQFLKNLGDDIENAYSPNISEIDSLQRKNEPVLYKMIDTIAEQQFYDSVFVWSQTPDSARYKLGFTKVGQGNGNYIPITTAANGRVFKWSAPINGIKQGSYEAKILLITPKKKQLITFGGNSKMLKNTLLNAEFALSNNDLNSFSTIDNDDNLGLASKFEITRKISLRDSMNLVLLLNVELTDKNFEAIDNFREPEFLRDWNLTELTEKAPQQWLKFTAQLNDSNSNNYNFDMQLLQKGNIYKAIKNNISISYNYKKKYTGNENFSLLFSEAQDLKTTFIKNATSVERKFEKFKIGFANSLENNLWQKTDSLVYLSDFSQAFDQWAVFFEIDNTENNFKLNYSFRNDYNADSTLLRKSSNSHEISFIAELNKNQKSKLSGRLNYKQLALTPFGKSTAKTVIPESTVSALINYSFNTLKGALLMNTWLETAAGQQNKTDYSYLEVAQGQGVYSWIDYNNNGQQELNEFEIANFSDEAKYVKIFLPTDEYERIYNMSFNQVFNIKPAAVWRKSEGLKKHLSAFSAKIAWKNDLKSRDKNVFYALLPTISATENAFMNLSSSLINTVNHKTANNNTRTSLIISKLNSGSYLTSGRENRSDNSIELSVIQVITQFIQIEFSTQKGINKTGSEFFEQKNFKINYSKAELGFGYQPQSATGLKLAYKYVHKLGETYSGENKPADIHSATFSSNISVSKQGSFNVEASYIYINFADISEESLNYNMLEGLKAGNNARMTITFCKALSKTLNLNLNYEGRISEKSKAIHTATVDLRAVF